jgi:hypothetical protein
MRKSARALGLVVVSLFAAAILGVASAFMAAFALGAATALIVPGTGTPDANVVDGYRENAADRYIAPFEPCTSTNGCSLDGVDYPASFFPLGFIGKWCPGFQCDTWNQSVGTGVVNLKTELAAAVAEPCTEEPCDVILFGYSQGGAVVSNTLREIGDLNLTPDQLSRLSVVVIGNAYNPDGGIFTRLGFLPTIPPPLDITFGPAMPTDTGIPIKSIGFEYDPVMYAPLYWGNPFAMLNALAAFETVHGNYLTPNENGPHDPIAYGYEPDEITAILAGTCPGPNCRVDSHGNEYWMIPAKSLPIVDLITGALPAALQPVVKPVADLVSPVLKVLIDLGYDWSGDPGQTRYLSPLPFNPIQNWPAVGVKLIVAAIQGIQAFISDLGELATTIAPSTPAPPTTTTVSPLALRSAPAPAAETLAVDQAADPDATASTPTLKVVKDSDTTVQQVAVENASTATSTEETPVTKPEPTADEKKFDDKKTDETKVDETKTDETKTDETKVDETKADDKKVDETKTDETKVDTEKKADEKKADADKDTDKKDADTGKAAA